MVETSSPKYIPAQSEMKRAVMMYLLVGILFSLRSSELTKYEYFHLCQSLGWWTIFILCLFILPLGLLLKFIAILVGIIVLVMLGFGAYFVKQAYDGNFQTDEDQNGFLSFFSGLGGWILDLFEVGKQDPNSSIPPVSN